MAKPEHYGLEEGRDAKHCIGGCHDGGNVCGGYRIHDPSACKPSGPSIFDPLATEIEKYDPTTELINGIISKIPEKERVHAYTFLEKAVAAMKDRAAQRDVQNGGKAERSMAATVAAFNGLTGRDLTEEEGWEFMILLKMVRGRQGGFRDDDYIDGAAYFGLLGECASGSRQT